MDEALRKAIDEAAAAVSNYKIPIYLSGPMPSGAVWCATCAVLFVGHFSADPAFHGYIRKQQEANAKDGMKACFVDLPETDDTPLLQPAVTVAPSVYSDMPMPTCWTHLKPFTKPTKEQREEMMRDRQGMPEAPRLIPGKAHDWGQL